MDKEEFKKKIKEEVGYDDDYINEISQYVDNEKDIEVFYNKITFLSKNGVSQSGLDNILSENPLFLTTDLEVVKAAVNFLKNIKIDEISNVIEANTELLSVSDKIMSENYKLLKILIPERELINMLKIDAEILSFNTDYFEKRLELLIKNGLKDKIKEIILNYFEVFEDNEEDIDIEELKEALL